ncbi:MAG TPA: hypothetical protein PKA10_15940 [Selenomonadales bacterium]|nr:hypothetical protein [Selenomonadales bacterium]
MGRDNRPEYRFWNGKNTKGSSSAGSPDLNGEAPRTGKTGAKYEVGNDTVAADNLQKNPRH